MTGDDALLFRLLSGVFFRAGFHPRLVCGPWLRGLSGFVGTGMSLTSE